MTTFGDLGNYVNGFTCSPREIKSPIVSISPRLSPLVPISESIKIDSLVVKISIGSHYPHKPHIFL